MSYWYNNNKSANKIGSAATSYVKLCSFLVRGLQYEPNHLQYKYLNEVAEVLRRYVVPGVTPADTQVKRLLFADDLVLFSASKEGLHQSLDILCNLSQTWELI